MKQFLTWSLALASLTSVATGCSPNKTTETTAAAPAAADTTAPAATESVVATTYTCPMDADVVRDQPGKCPKCGMDLVKK